MAFWFMNVVLAALLIRAVTGSVPPITSSVLGLMGIGAGTALGAALVDQGGANQPPSPSRNFLSDVLTDGASIALHRFQMFVWTPSERGIWARVKEAPRWTERSISDSYIPRI